MSRMGQIIWMYGGICLWFQTWWPDLQMTTERRGRTVQGREDVTTGLRWAGEGRARFTQQRKGLLFSPGRGARQPGGCSQRPSLARLPERVAGSHLPGKRGEGVLWALPIPPAAVQQLFQPLETVRAHTESIAISHPTQASSKVATEWVWLESRISGSIWVSFFPLFPGCCENSILFPALSLCGIP